MDFWIDVGGTFTDCLLRPENGELPRLKVLSTGVTKGSAQPGSTAQALVDAGRRHDPPDFWQGYRLTLLDRGGRPTDSVVVRSFDAATGALALETPLDATIDPGQAY